MKTRSRCKFLCTFLYLLTALLNFDPAHGRQNESLFRSDKVIRIELKTDFTSILQERTLEPVDHKGTLTYKGTDGKNVKLNVEVTSRGNFRRDPANCDFPPLLVNFKKGTKNTLFDNQDKLKLVTPCKIDKDVIQEYLVYKMYNLVTEKSLNVWLVSITYFDTGKNKKLYERYSFFIENEDHAATRNNAIEIQKKMLTPFDLDSVVFRNMAFFQYMIGNKDWFVTSRKNIVLMQPADSSKAPFPVPYDFDFAGFVDADYTRPVGVPRKLLEERRVFKGICYKDNEITEAIDYFRALRPAFESLIRNMQILPRYNQTENLNYIREFYSVIDDPQSIREKILANCETKADYNIR